jgi:hypothetical protein
MKGKGILLLVALVLPTCIFVFLKMFGKNEFAVEPLFQVAPAGGIPTACGHVTFPYKVASDSFPFLPQQAQNSFVLISLGEKMEKEGETQLKRVYEELGDSTVSTFYRRFYFQDKAKDDMYRKCVLLMPESANMILMDTTGTIRGQYNINDREDVDRMITELTIVLKKY